MSRVITVTWAPEAIDRALEFGSRALQAGDGETVTMPVMHLACLLDLGRHALAQHEKTDRDLFVLAQVGRMYLDALDDDPENEHLTLPEAMLVTEVREAVERWENP